MTESPNLFDRIRMLLSQWLKGSQGTSPQPGNTTVNEPLAPLAPRVLSITIDPVIDANGQRLLSAPQTQRWSKVDDLVNQYINDIDEISGGLVRYQVIERITLNQFPRKEDGFTYTGASYLQALSSGQYHSPDWMDYDLLVNQQNLVQRMTSNELDEVWLFGGPGFGFYESRMGGHGAFWCNAPAMDSTAACPRRFIIMGFNAERTVGEMLESFGHRSESIMSQVFGSLRFTQDAYNAGHEGAPVDLSKFATIHNNWERFGSYNKITPGKSNVGLMHFAPNSLKDYEWGNMTPVLSCADDWLQFPNLPSPPNYRMMDAHDWGAAIRAHHKWWFQHLPKAPGRLNGTRNNWWHYIAKVDDEELH